MKQGWEVKKLGEVCEYDKTPFKGSDLPYIGLEDIQSQTGKLNGSITPKHVKSLTFGFNQDHVLYGRLRPYLNKVLMPDFSGHCSTEIFPIKPHKGILDRSFLFHWLIADETMQKINSTWTGATLPRANMNTVLDFKIAVPPLPEQQRIVAILDEAFEAIGKAKANAERNLQNAKELFQSELNSIFTNKGPGWEEKKLGEVCELKSGTTISPLLERTQGDVLYTKVGDMNLPENQIEINNSSRFVNSHEININQIIPEGAIIFPKRGGAIATNKKRKIIKPTIVDLNTMAIIPGKNIDKEYFFNWFQLINLNDLSNGSSIPQINNYSFDDVYIPYPTSLQDQKVIVNKLDTLSTETKKLEEIYQKKIGDLEELKKSILEMAFKGEL